MVHPNESELLVALPEAAATPLRAALALNDLCSGVAEDLLDRAFAAVEFPRLDAARPVVPLPSELTPIQKALAEILAYRGPFQAHAAIPRAGWSRRRWWGVDPPGVLEKPHTFAHAGKVLTQPLWRAIALRDDGAALVGALPVGERLEAFGELVLAAYELRFAHDAFPPKALAALRSEGKAWAPRYADWLLDLLENDWPQASRTVPLAVEWPLYLSLVRSTIPLDPRWDSLLPLGSGAHAPLMVECVRAIPEERRAAAIGQALRGHDAADRVEILGELAKVPSLEAVANQLRPALAPSPPKKKGPARRPPRPKKKRKRKPGK